MKKISISTFQLQLKYGDKEALRIAKEIGADAVDFGLDPNYNVSDPDSVYAKSVEEMVAYFSSLKEYAEQIGLEIGQTHGRVCGYGNQEDDDEIFRQNVYRDCLATAALGAPVCVLHGVTTHRFLDASAEFMHDLNFKMFQDIIPYAKEAGIKIATETFGDLNSGEKCDFFGNIDEFIKSYERICSVGDNADYITVCMDTGHSNKATKFNDNPQVPEVIRKLGKNITILHLNDNDTSGDQHLIPNVGKGGFFPVKHTIDWDATFDALDEVGYQGIYNMELELHRYGSEILPDTAAFAIKVLRNFLKQREVAKQHDER